MTLILLMANMDQVVVISDRRLTFPNGKIASAVAPKAALVRCSDGRAIMAFTGLATLGRENTQQWLLANACEVGTSVKELADGLCDRLTTRFGRLPSNVGPVNRRTSVVLAGYLNDPQGPKFFSCLISNFERPLAGPPSDAAWDEFITTTVYTKPELPYEPYGNAFGQWTAVDKPGFDAWWELARKRIPARGLEAKGVDLALTAARSPASRNTVGEDLMVAVLPSNASHPVTGRYLPNDAEPVAYFLDEVVGGPTGFAVSLGEIRADDPLAAPTSFPRTGRNVPCPCGSGNKFKRCHGRSGGYAY